MVAATLMRPTQVKLVEVGPRDGLQFEPVILPAPIKIGFVKQLLDAGLTDIEVGTFGSKRYVQALADTADVVQGLKPFRPGVRYTVLTSTPAYLEAAIPTGITSVAVFVGTSDRFNEANLRLNIDAALENARQVIARAHAHRIEVRGYVSICWGGPQDPVPEPAHVAMLVESLLAMGCYQISLGDTTGYARTDSVARLLEYLFRQFPVDRFAGHFHDVGGVALANIDRALDFGVSTFDTACGRLGGCLASGALTANAATEEVVAHLHAQGIATGVDLAALQSAAQFIKRELRKAPGAIAPGCV